MVKRTSHIGIVLDKEMGGSLGGISPVCNCSSIHLSENLFLKVYSSARVAANLSCRKACSLSKSICRRCAGCQTGGGSCPAEARSTPSQGERVPVTLAHPDGPAAVLPVPLRYTLKPSGAPRRRCPVMAQDLLKQRRTSMWRGGPRRVPLTPDQEGALYD
jgi:hypothetical protein